MTKIAMAIFVIPYLSVTGYATVELGGGVWRGSSLVTLLVAGITLFLLRK